MSNRPLVSVVIPVWNAEPYLDEAISSIVTQTYSNIELLLVNDASSDGSENICRNWIGKDARVRLVNQPVRQGISAALNAGIAASSGEYIARMDQDDVSLPTRIAKQIDVLEAHPEVGVCCASAVTIGASSGSVWRVPNSDTEIRTKLFFGPPFCHPTTVLRKQTLDQLHHGYDSNFDGVEDFRLWVALSQCTQFASTAEILFHYRTHPGQMSRERSEATISKFEQIYGLLLNNLNLVVNSEELRLHVDVMLGRKIVDFDHLRRAHDWLVKLDQANVQCSEYPRTLFANSLCERLFDLCYQASHLGLPVWNLYRSSPLRQYGAMPLPRRLKLVVRCLVGYSKTDRQ